MEEVFLITYHNSILNQFTTTAMKRFFAGSCFLCFLLNAWHVFGQKNEVAFAGNLFNFFNAAKEQAEAKEHLLALAYLDSALMIAPDYAQIRYAKARQLMLAGQEKAAWDELQLLVNRNQQFVRKATEDSVFTRHPNYKQFSRSLGKLDQTINKSIPFVTIPESDVVPEGVAYDPIEKALYVSSIYKRKILKIKPDKSISDFVVSGQDGLLSVIGMEVDAKRRELWVCSSYDPSNSVVGGDTLTRNQTAIHRLDLKTGRLIKKYELADTLPHFFNDLTVLPKGDVYITDSHEGNVYQITTEADKLEPVFDKPFLIGANGITKDPKGENLYIASWLRGIIKYTIKDKSWVWLKAIDPYVSLSGIDGLAFYKGDLIANSPIEIKGVVRLRLNKAGNRVQTVDILEYGNPLFGESTTGELAGNTFYFIANAGLEAYDRSTGKLDKSKLRQPVILQIKLK